VELHETEVPKINQKGEKGKMLGIRLRMEFFTG